PTGLAGLGGVRPPAHLAPAPARSRAGAVAGRIMPALVPGVVAGAEPGPADGGGTADLAALRLALPHRVAMLVPPHIVRVTPAAPRLMPVAARHAAFQLPSRHPLRLVDDHPVVLPLLVVPGAVAPSIGRPRTAVRLALGILGLVERDSRPRLPVDFQLVQVPGAQAPLAGDQVAALNLAGFGSFSGDRAL